MGIKNPLLCFLVVATPVAGITLGARTKKPSSTPPARHINWDPQCLPGKSCGGRNNAEVAGLMNMAFIFNFLVALSKEYNATVSITGGVNGADMHLEPRHSDHINPSWAHYFDVTANEGNPFNDLKQDEACQEVWDVNVDFRYLFKKGETCLTFRERFDHYTNKHAKELITKHKAGIPYSKDVEDSANLLKSKLPENYGVIHVRRCDRLFTNRECTAVNTIAERVKTAKKPVDGWVVFSYAEEGYDEMLQTKLTEMGQKAFFEKDVSFALNPNQEDDNYFSYWVTDKVMQGATVLLNTHNCKNNPWGNLMQKPHHKGNLHQSQITLTDQYMSMQKDMAESKAICTWHEGDGAKPMPKHFQDYEAQRIKEQQEKLQEKSL